jgi:hypothetical protein
MELNPNRLPDGAILISGFGGEEDVEELVAVPQVDTLLRLG